MHNDIIPSQQSSDTNLSTIDMSGFGRDLNATKNSNNHLLSRKFFRFPISQSCRKRFILIAIFFLVIGSLSITLLGDRFSAKAAAVSSYRSYNVSIPRSTIAGLNKTVKISDLNSFTQKIIKQPINFYIADQKIEIPSNTIKSWLQINVNTKEGIAGFHVDSKAISNSLAKLAIKYTKPPVDQVNSSSGGVNHVILPGINGLKVNVDPTLSAVLSKNLLNAEGEQFNLNSTILNYQNFTPANFGKLIEVNLTSKQMYIYENGILNRSYGVSAGGPATPTPVGEYHIFEKLAVQDMYGYGPTGQYYFQPHVRWINYFKVGGFAVHGVYWHPLSWFGNINSSHGCVGIPEDEAQWVFNWAPTGTPVITYN